MEKYKIAHYQKSGSMWFINGGKFIITENEYIVKYVLKRGTDMSNEKFDNFIRNAKKATKKAANTTIELADIASLKVKLQGQSVKLSEKFEVLGRLSYDKLANEADNAEKIAAAVAEIEKIKNNMENIKAEIKAKKLARERNRAESSQTKEEE